MRIEIGSRFARKFKKLAIKDRRLADKIADKVDLFKQDPRHPSLRLHKLAGFNEDTWSLSISGDVRVLFVYLNDGILLVDLGGHDEVY